MTGAAGASVAGAGAAGAIIQAAKASGVIVRVEPDQFIEILLRMEKPLIVAAEPQGGPPRPLIANLLGGIFKASCRYLTSYRGIAFFTKAAQPLPLPKDAEIVAASKIWVPGEM